MDSIQPKAVAEATLIAPVSKEVEKLDEGELRHGRETHRGFKIGNYLQTPPFFFTRDKWPVPLVDNYRGASCFLIGGGPSFASIDKTKLAQPGIMTMGMNNSVKSFRPNLWTCVDDPASFLKSIWIDPTIQKLVPMDHMDKTIFDNDRWQMTNIKVGECPNTVYYKRNEMFQPEQFLYEDSINWGNSGNMGGGRSVMLAAIRILWLLGFRRVYLLGVDFKMDKDTKYHFEQDRSDGSIKGNNATYKQLNERFGLLRPHFEKNGFYVYNCNPDSNLTAFETVSFDDAFKLARSILPADLTAERSLGLYDRKANEREHQKKAARAALPNMDNPRPKAKSCDNCSRKYVHQVNVQLNAARTAMQQASGKASEMRAKLEANDPSFDQDTMTTLDKDAEEKKKSFKAIQRMRDSMVGVDNAV